MLVKGGRVEYVTDEGSRQLYWNIPIANTTTVLLGTGTSVTQAAMRELAKAGVLVGFCGGGGTPLFSANEVDVEVAWFSPQSEYRSTEYLQAWVKFWFVDELRLQAARQIQQTRLDWVERQWLQQRSLLNQGFSVAENQLAAALNKSRSAIASAPDVAHLLTLEARLSKTLYQLVANSTDYGEFTRAQRGDSVDAANQFLDHGNYLAYGLGATACWVLGLPHGLAVLHGKTRRGGLVFDVADLIKDALIMPQAFLSAVRGDEENEFRRACIELMSQAQALDFMIDTLKAIAGNLSVKAPT